MRPLIYNVLKLKRYISKKTLAKFSLFLALLGMAYVFDLYHAESEVIRVIPDSGEETGQSYTYFCNPVAGFSLKPPVEKALHKKPHHAESVKSLMILHGRRAFHTLKAEIPDIPEQSLLQNLLAFRNYHHSDPGDQPPLG